MKILPYGKVTSTQDLGKILRDKRREDQLTQAELAALLGIGVRFISDVENGKPTVEFAKVLKVITGLGLEVILSQRGWQVEE